MTDELLAPLPIGPFFRFPDETVGMDALRSAGFMTTVTDDEGNETEQLLAYTHDRAIDVVGVLYNNDGVYDVDENGEDIVVSPPTVMPGWHVNYLGALPEGWEEFEVTPENPKRVFA